jgi:pantoate--beta-alanine ligase
VLINSISDFDKVIENKVYPLSVGLVPTMGALHEGHLSLIKKALQECNLVVVSVFVNPTQFNNPEDLSKYPRTIESDLEAIHNLDENILVYVPDVEEIYPKGAQSEHFDFGSVSKFMEGQFRQGHFDGVGTVLKRLFSLIKPDKAFFGKKDFQQLAVVKKLIEITGQNVNIVGCETYREKNGLAKSSRNKLLSDEEKEQAGIIFENLTYIKNHINHQTINQIKKEVEHNFDRYHNFRLEYCEIAEEKTLIPTIKIESGKTYRAFIAAYCNDVRLIDNMSLN